MNIHALKGEVKVTPWCDVPEFLCEFETLYLKRGEETLTVESARVVKGNVIVKFEGIDTPEQANLMRNKILYMDRDDVELDENTYFVQDLVGLMVKDADNGKEYGELTDVLQTGANDVYVIKSADREYLIPAIPDVVIETSIDDGYMIIRPLEGLFDDED